mmetsp:Transcript_36467/g.47052  ORF Transcript_36467/g.47052 Transcript_36467/m.47052 type:complete len:315 (-) Transcript_36467:546-1490(-)
MQSKEDILKFREKMEKEIQVKKYVKEETINDSICEMDIVSFNGYEYKDTTCTPLLLAIRQNDIDMIKLLIQYGACVDIFPIETDKNKSPVICAINDGRSECLKLLVEHGAEVNITNMQHVPALMIGLYDSNDPTECFEILLKAGANLEVTNTQGLTPLIYSMVVRDLPRWSQRLIELGANINAINPNTGCPLIIQLLENHRTCKEPSKSFKMLLDAKPNLEATDLSGNTALMVAVRNDQEKWLELLLEAGAKVNKVNDVSVDIYSLNSINKSCVLDIYIYLPHSPIEGYFVVQGCLLWSLLHFLYNFICKLTFL